MFQPNDRNRCESILSMITRQSETPFHEAVRVVSILAAHAIGNKKLELIKVPSGAFSAWRTDMTEGRCGFVYFSDLPSLRRFEVGKNCFSSLSHVDFRSGYGTKQ